MTQGGASAPPEYSPMSCEVIGSSLVGLAATRILLKGRGKFL